VIRRIYLDFARSHYSSVVSRLSLSRKRLGGAVVYDDDNGKERGMQTVAYSDPLTKRRPYQPGDDADRVAV